MSGDFTTVGGPPDPISFLRQLSSRDSDANFSATRPRRDTSTSETVDEGTEDCAEKAQEPPARCRPEVSKRITYLTSSLQFTVYGQFIYYFHD